MWQHFEFIYELFSNSKEFCKGNPSYRKFARFLGISDGKLQKWREAKQWPSAQDLKILHDKFNLSYSWLVTGEGAPYSEQETNLNTAQNNAAIPLIGFADCGVQGWHGAMTIPVTVSAPTWHDKMIACMASGESMLPSGIGNGHICYCDPTLEPVMGEPVYVEQLQGMSTIKIFCGRTERQGKEYIDLKGWLDKEDELTVQKEFHINVLASQIKHIAPVIYVRRRL